MLPAKGWRFIARPRITPTDNETAAESTLSRSWSASFLIIICIHVLVIVVDTDIALDIALGFYAQRRCRQPATGKVRSFGITGLEGLAL